METMKKLFTPKRILALLILIAVVVFAFQNMNEVELTLLFFTIRIPLLFLILIIFGLGITCGWMYKRSDVKKIVGNVQKETQKEISSLQDQIKEMNTKESKEDK